VAKVPDRGQVWWGEIEQVGRRPLLIMTRSAAIPVLNSVLAAPITRTIRDLPTELRLGPAVDCSCPVHGRWRMFMTDPGEIVESWVGADVMIGGTT
jgi:mRNA-degrading endonuclease toxin of MazEF toxin-antitoxin module